LNKNWSSSNYKSRDFGSLLQQLIFSFLSKKLVQRVELRRHRLSVVLVYTLSQIAFQPYVWDHNRQYAFGKFSLSPRVMNALGKDLKFEETAQVLKGLKC